MLTASSMVSSVSATTVMNTSIVADRDPEIRANLKQARYFMGKGNYVSAKRKLLQMLELDSSNSEAQNLLRQCNQKIDAQLQQEKSAFEETCTDGSLSALEKFISNYPNSIYVTQAKTRIDEYQTWMLAKQANTIATYQNYISTSSTKSYKTDAEKAILDIESIEAWQSCCNTTTIPVVESYLSKFPNSPNDKQAQYLLKVLKGEKYYAEGSHILALSSFKEAQNMSPLKGTNALHYKELQEESEYSILMKSNDTNALWSFLQKTPSTNKYYNIISNRFAIIKASRLNGYSFDEEFNTVRDYTKDRATRKIVNKYIDDANKSRRYINHQNAVQAHKRWWKRNYSTGWTLGIDKLEETVSFNTGFRFRLGTTEDLFNFNLGIDYMYLRYFAHDDYSSNTDYTDIGHQITVPASIKFNIAEVSNNCKLYLGFAGEVGFKIADVGDFKRCMNDITIDIEPQIGLNWSRIDLGFYYKKYLNGYNIIKSELGDVEDQRIGLFMTFYF